MTGERKKKLRLLLRRKAAEELKRQQEAKANERRRVIAERTGTKSNYDLMNESELKAICKQFHERLRQIESSKWDLEYAVSRKELEVSNFCDHCASSSEIHRVQSLTELHDLDPRSIVAG